MPTVYITNDGPHDFTPAARFGNFRFLTRGRLDRFATGGMYREIEESLRDSGPEDYLLITSFTVASCIAAGLLGHKHGCINLLIYKREGSTGVYVPRTVSFT